MRGAPAQRPAALRVVRHMGAHPFDGIEIRALPLSGRTHETVVTGSLAPVASALPAAAALEKAKERWTASPAAPFTTTSRALPTCATDAVSYTHLTLPTTPYV